MKTILEKTIADMCSQVLNCQIEIQRMELGEYRQLKLLSNIVYLISELKYIVKKLSNDSNEWIK